jgi:NTE family protein
LSPLEGLHRTVTQHFDRPQFIESSTSGPRQQLDGPGVTLVLGGGGFKGMSHIGVFAALEAAKIPIERIVGTSAGALIGASYAHSGRAEDVFERVNRFVASEAFQRKGFVSFGTPSGNSGVSGLMSRVLSGIKRQVALERMFRRSSAFGGASLRFVVRSLVPNVAIEDMAVPLSIAALDLSAGEEVLLTSGPACSAVAASSSVPGFFPPVERDGRRLVDTGIVNNLPTRAARASGATRIVAVDLSASLEADAGAAAGADIGMDVLLRAQDISTMHANRRWGGLADVTIFPNLDGRNWLDASNPAEVIDAGAEATRRALPDIVALLAAAR